MTKSLSRRDVVRLGALGLAGGVGAAALAACGEGEVEVRTVEVEKIVTVTEIKEVEVEKVVEKEVVREVPVERVVTQEVQVEKIVEVEKVVEVPQETQVEGVFEIGPVKAVRFGNYRDLTPYNPQYGGKITHAAPGAINNLDPLHFPDAWSLMGGGQPLFDALIAHGPGGQLAPWLATDWSVSDDLLTYTFQLRNDVQFHDGTPFNAEAAKFNFELWMDPDMNPGWNANIGNQLASVTAPGDFTIELKLNEVNVFFLDLLAGGSAVFASPKAVAEYGEDLTRNPVSTGPYKFKEWKENISLTMVRNDDYNWGSAVGTQPGAGVCRRVDVVRAHRCFGEGGGLRGRRAELDAPLQPHRAAAVLRESGAPGLHRAWSPGSRGTCRPIPSTSPRMIWRCARR